MANLIQIVLFYEDVYDVLNQHCADINEESPTREEVDDIMTVAAHREGSMSYFEMKDTLRNLRNIK